MKVIHEFGHGLSCKAFGGEVHEMGFLFLCFSPCMYCNVSDAWTLPNKWQRIIISVAGIYVELMIAAIATFVWWNTPSQPFVNNLCLSLMVVCSVSTVVFNANPLMRYDGYYVLADWLEIPNLRDRSNRYLQERWSWSTCLGIEVQPEPYMALWPQDACSSPTPSSSYVYRWVVTFGILYFMYTFLKPYKLGAISYLLGTAALGTMVGFPIYKLGKALHRRGRVPDMKPVRVWILASVVAAALIAFLVIPFPMRVKGLTLVQVDPNKARPVVVPPLSGVDPGRSPSFLTEVYVRDGQEVKQGDQLARLTNPEFDIRRQIIQQEIALRVQQIGKIQAELSFADNLKPQLLEAETTRDTLLQTKRLMDDQATSLTLLAPCDGKVRKLIKVEEIGKAMEQGAPICEVADEHFLQAIMLVDPSNSKLVAAGQDAWIRIHGRGYNFFRGKVVGVSGKEATEIQPQFSKNHGGEIVTEPDPQTRGEKPTEQLYQVTIDFTELDRGIQPGVMSRCMIVVEPKTLFWRLRRYLANTFNLGL